MLKIPEKLRYCWYVGAYGHEVEPGRPFATTLLDEALGTWRTAVNSDRSPSAFYNWSIYHDTLCEGFA